MISLAIMCCVNGLAEMEAIIDVPISATPVEVPGLSMTTGLSIDHENRTMVVQMDNEPGARPQKGVGSADIVYETELYNGGYTRYTVVFNDTIPEKIEAIRSAAW